MTAEGESVGPSAAPDPSRMAVRTLALGSPRARSEAAGRDCGSVLTLPEEDQASQALAMPSRSSQHSPPSLMSRKHTRLLPPGGRG